MVPIDSVDSKLRAIDKALRLEQKKRIHNNLTVNPDLERLLEFAELGSKGTSSYSFVLSVKRQVLTKGFISIKQTEILESIANKVLLKDL